MIGRIIEIAGTGRYLHTFRGFMEINHKSETLGRVPLDNISALIISGHGATYSNHLLVTLARRGIPVVLCGKQCRPEAVIFPCEYHHIQGGRIDSQIACPLPMKKRLWQQLVKAKLQSQSAVLGYFGLPSAPLEALVRRVKTGDNTNMEGVAARRYWSILMGKSFRRNRKQEGGNALLNYGYTILRATVARHLIATGLNPGIGFAHKNDGNPMRLVDDLIEPFRPVVDAQVVHLLRANVSEVDSVAKRKLAELMSRSIPYESGTGPISNAIEKTCNSLVQVLNGERKELSIPKISSGSLQVVFNNIGGVHEISETREEG